MLSRLWKKLLFNQSRKNKNKQTAPPVTNGNDTPLNPLLDENVKKLRNVISNSSDIIFCEFYFRHNTIKRGTLIYIDGMADRDMLQKNVLQPLMDNTLTIADKSDLSTVLTIKMNLIPITEAKIINTFNELLDNLMSGSSILLIDGFEEAITICAKQWEQRSISQPETENVVRGPREGFTEDLRTNISMLRRKIRKPNFCIESFCIGGQTNTAVSIAYIKGTADPALVKEVKKRLEEIQIDSVLDSGYIEQYIEDNPLSIYPTIANSEKPDNAAGKILEGRVAILVDGSPFALTVPMLFVESFQVSEDYYSRTIFSSFIRLLRFLSYTISILSPAIYVALTVYHQELIPTQLLISIAAGREPVPLPAVFEAAIMIITFDILREAGVRLPRPIGSAVSIVGALVLGQSAVTAGLISPIMVIVVAATAIASFVVPSQTDSGTILRYIYLILAGIAGGFGVIMGMLLNLIYITSLRSFGQPYFSPIAPLIPWGQKDVFIRLPLWITLKKPKPFQNKSPVINDLSIPDAKKNPKKDSNE